MKRKSKKIKTLLGCLLLIVSIAAMIGWELYGRDMIYYDQVVVMKTNVNKGHIIVPEDIEYKKLDNNSILQGAIKDTKKLIGMETLNYIAENGQVVEQYVVDSKYSLKENERIMQLPKSWIISLPETIRRRDKIFIYAINENESSSDKYYILKAIVAYVKDNNNKEIYDISSNRFEGSSNISDIEIIISDEDFSKMQTFIKNGYKLIIMYK